MHRHLLLFFLFHSSFSSQLGPPKLLSQPPSEAWFQLDVSSSSSRPTLKCQASENAETYLWYHNDIPLEIGGDIEWVRPGQSGTIIFKRPRIEYQGYYQCFVSNIFGTAVTTKVHFQMGVLDHFPPRPLRKVQVREGDSLTLSCLPPRGNPTPTVFWLYRDTEQDSVIETIRRRHVSADEQGRLHFANVQLHDGRQNLLYECAATSPVLHGEYRSGDQIQLEVEPRNDVRPVDIHDLYLSPSEVTVNAGGKLKIQCIFGGRPTPTVFWSKLDGELPKWRMKDLSTAESDFGRSLVVENIHPEDAGRYECRAQHRSHTINVRVMAAPYWETEPPRDVTQAEGSTTELECLAAGQPAPIVRWSINGRPMHELGEDPRRLLLDNGRLLRLSSLNHDLDTGVFQCNASNPLGYVFANAFVHVKAHAPRFLMPSQRVWKVVLHSTVALNCDVDAAPAAVVRWVDADDRPLQVVGGKTKLLSNNTFIISDVNTADEGLYYCNVSNKYGINRATNKLQVYKPTYFLRVPSPRRLSIEAGTSADLHCQAVSDPRLSVEYKWTLDGRIINNTRTFKVSSGHLHISSARGRHSGSIECASITDVDIKRSAMNLVVRDVPSNPLVEAVDCNERKATVRWTRSSNHDDPINRYLLEMHTDFMEKNHWEKLEEERNTDKEHYEVDITLTPWVNYTFRVVAVNSHGRSDAKVGEDPEDAAHVVECRTRPSFPYTNPAGVWAEGDAPDNLVVHWNPMDKYFWNAPNLQYLVKYKLNEPHSAWTEFLVEDALANSTIIRELPTFREFAVQVTAVNAKGASILEAEVVKGYSGEDVPAMPPTSFRLLRVVNFTSAEFEWIGVEEHSVNGLFEGYEIEYWKDRHPTSKHRTLIGRNNSKRVITTFAANSNYTAVIRTKNKRYRSEASGEIHFSMPEGVPSKVDNLRVVATGARSLLVQWKPPRVANGKIRGYFLSFQNDRNETEETYVVHKQNHYLHEKCIPDTGYKVSVWGETSAGEGAKSMRPVRTWTERAPDIPMFRVLNISMETASFEWVPHNHSIWRMPGSAFYLNYSIHGSSDVTQTPTVYLPSTRIFLSGLLPSTQYQIVGVALDGPAHSSSPPMKMMTSSEENVSHLNQESLRSAAWFVAILCAVAIALITLLLTSYCDLRRGQHYPVRTKELEIAHQLDKEEEREFLDYHYGYTNTQSK